MCLICNCVSLVCVAKYTVSDSLVHVSDMNCVSLVCVAKYTVSDSL